MYRVVLVDLIHDGRHVGFAVITPIRHALLRDKQHKFET